MSVLDCRSLLLVRSNNIFMYALLIVVGVSFNQSSYSVNETSSQVEIVLVLSSPLSFDVTAAILDTDSGQTAASKLNVYYCKHSS